MTDKALGENLKKYHRGQENAASSRELEAAFHIKGTELRRAVNRLRYGKGGLSFGEEKRSHCPACRADRP